MLDILIVGGSPEPSTPELVSRLASHASKVVACDAACAICKKASINIDVVVGDLDSVTDEALDYARSCDAEFLKFPADKDETDLGLALEYASKERVCGQVAAQSRKFPYCIGLTCVSGGRLDHMLAVLGTICQVSDLSPVIYEDDYICMVNKAPFALRLDEVSSRYPLVAECFDNSFLGRTLSLVSLDGDARVSETGMKWDLDHVTLKPLSDLGVSNIVKKPDAFVELFSGICALIIIQGYLHKQHHCF